jgi:hypothetical protein
MDPLTALGLASNILQFLDFACKLVSSTRKIYSSPSQTSDESQFLHGIAQHIVDLSNKFIIPTTSGTGFIDKKLRDIATECENVSSQLLDVIRDLEAKNNTLWSSFLVALKEVWHREEIGALMKKLSKLQVLLNTHLLFLLK